MAELAASNTGAQAVVADTNRIILELIGEAVLALGHGADEHAHALLGAEVGYVVADAHDGGVEGEGDFATVRGQVVRDGVLDDFE